MIIKRFGREIELNILELIRAYDEYRIMSALRDIKSIYQRKGNDIELTDEQLRSIAKEAVDNLSKNTKYKEACSENLNNTFNSCVNRFLGRTGSENEEKSSLDEKILSAELKAGGNYIGPFDTAPER